MRLWWFWLCLICLGCSTSIFGIEKSQDINNCAQKIETLMAVGDLNFSGDFGKRIVANPEYPWINVKSNFKNACLLMGNLEGAFTTNETKPYVKKEWLLKADPRTCQALVTAGFDLVTLANNHIMDYGPQSLEITLQTLHHNKIKTTGAGSNQAAARQPAIIKTPKGVTLAFLAYSTTYPNEFWATALRPGTAYANPSAFLADIKAAKTRADHVIVSFHWSRELQTMAANYQVPYAHQCIDAGASLIIGHHPHVLQGFEVYHDGLIAYSLGNFAFGSLTEKVRDSAILAVDFTKTTILKGHIYPVNVYNRQVFYQPHPLTGSDATRVIETINQRSRPFHTPIVITNNSGLIQIKK